MNLEFKDLVAEFVEKLSMYEDALCINDIEDYISDFPIDLMERLKSVLDFHRQEYLKAEKELVSALTLILLAGAETQEKYLGYVCENYNSDTASKSRKLTEELLDSIFNECDSFHVCKDTTVEAFLEQFKTACS